MTNRHIPVVVVAVVMVVASNSVFAGAGCDQSAAGDDIPYPLLRERLRTIISDASSTPESAIREQFVQIVAQSAAECGLLVDAIRLCESLGDRESMLKALLIIQHEMARRPTVISWQNISDATTTPFVRDRVLSQVAVDFARAGELEEVDRSLQGIVDQHLRIDAAIRAATAAREAGHDADARRLADVANEYLDNAEEASEPRRGGVVNRPASDGTLQMPLLLQMYCSRLAVEMYAEGRTEEASRLLGNVDSRAERDAGVIGFAEYDAINGDLAAVLRWREGLPKDSVRQEFDRHLVEVLINTGNLARCKEYLDRVDAPNLVGRLARRFARSGARDQALIVLQEAPSSLIDGAMIDAEAAWGAASSNSDERTLEFLNDAIRKVEVAGRDAATEDSDMIAVGCLVLKTSALLEPGLAANKRIEILKMVDERAYKFQRNVSWRHWSSKPIALNIRVLNAGAECGSPEVAEAAFARGWSASGDSLPWLAFVALAAGQTGGMQSCETKIESEASLAMRCILWHAYAFGRQQAMAQGNVVNLSEMPAGAAERVFCELGVMRAAFAGEASGIYREYSEWLQDWSH